MSGAARLDNEALEAASKDRDERDCNKSNEVLFRPLENGVQPPVAANPGERPFNHPADARGNEPSVSAARDGLNRDAESLTGPGQAFAPIAKVAERRTLEAAVGEFTQNRDDGFGVMAVRRRDIDRQRHAVFLNGDLDLEPRIFLPPSMPRAKQLGAERQERLSITTTLGSGLSPQARRQVRRSRSSSRRQSPSRVQRANSPWSVLKGMSQSWPMARHCMPQKQTHQVAITALRSLAPVSGGLGPGRCGRAPSLTIAVSSASTASTNVSTSANASHGPGDVLAGRTAVPIVSGLGAVDNDCATACCLS